MLYAVAIPLRWLGYSYVQKEGAVDHIMLAAMQSAASTSSVAAQTVPIPIAFEMLAVVVASASGVLAAREHKLDLIGAVGMAMLCALGGGLIRDVILQEGNVYILQQPLAIPVTVATAAAVFVFPRMVEKPDRLIAVLDIFAVGLFAVMGADKANAYGYPAITCVVMGFLTAVGGGLLRDVCLARVPEIFQRGNLYAMAAVAGAVTYMVLLESLGMWNILAAVVATGMTMFVRWWSLRYNIMSPTEVDLTRVKRVAAPIRRVAAPIARPIRRWSGKPGVMRHDAARDDAGAMQHKVGTTGDGPSVPQGECSPARGVEESIEAVQGGERAPEKN